MYTVYLYLYRYSCTIDGETEQRMNFMHCKLEFPFAVKVRTVHC